MRMESHRFDQLFEQLQSDETDRRRFLVGAAALALGVSGVKAVLAAQGGEVEPTAAIQDGGASDPAGQTEDPDGVAPFDWFCWPHPDFPVPLFPVVPEARAVLGSRVRWYGLRLEESDLLAMAAIGTDGQEVSRSETWRGDDGAVHVRFADGVAEVDGRIAAERDAAGEMRLVGTLDGQSIDSGAEAAPVLEPAQRELLDMWAPLTPELAGLLDVLATVEGDSTVATGLSCTVAGYLAAFNCMILSGGTGIATPKCVIDAQDLWETYCT